MSAPTAASHPDAVTGAAPASRTLQLLGAAAIVGIAGDVLLRGGVWRLGFAAWIVLAAVLLAAQLDRAERERRLMLAGLGLAALGLAFRDVDFAYTIDLLSVLCMGALIAWHGTVKRLARISPVEAVRAAVLGPLSLAFGAPGALRTALESAGGSTEATRRSRALLIGGVIAIPPLFVVLALLSDSDRVFEGIVQRAVDFVAVDALRHVVIAAVITWLAAGWMRVSRGERTIVRVPEAPTVAVPFLTVAVGLYGLVALLGLFLATQTRVLFGGADYLREAVGLTVAEYARNGFFEMVAAAGVVLGTLVIAEWLLAREDMDGRRQYRFVGTLLVVEVLALLGSALARMSLYVREFGLTVDRGFALSVMVLVAAALVVVVLTTLRGHGDRFGPLALGVTIAWVVMFNLINLEGIVVRVNVARAEAGAAFDATYHGTLSADALPVLRAQAPRLPAAECEALRSALGESWAYRSYQQRDEDVRARSLSLILAWRWIDEGQPLTCASGGARVPAR